jgi:hypothetical protein
MKKIKLDRVLSRFQSGLDGIDSTLKGAEGAPPAERKFLAESSLLAAASRWEGFVHELFVAHINHDSSVTTKTILQRIRQSVEQKHGSYIASCISLGSRKRLSRAQVLEVLDQEGRNVTFDSAKRMLERAQEYLPVGAASRFLKLSKGDQASIDAWRALRNVLAHQSDSSRSALDDALSASDLRASLRRGKHRINDVGSYLESRYKPARMRRIRVLLKIMSRIAASLCPSKKKIMVRRAK